MLVSNPYLINYIILKGHATSPMISSLGIKDNLQLGSVVPPFISCRNLYTLCNYHVLVYACACLHHDHYLSFNSPQ